MYNVQFRIHRSWSDVSGIVVSNFFSKCEKGFLFQHEADEEVARQHVHGYLFGLSIKRSSLSEQIATKLNLNGNADFFTSEKCSKSNPRPLDISGAYCYGSKFNTIAPLFLKNISPVLLEQLQAYAESRKPISKLAAQFTDVLSLIADNPSPPPVKKKMTQYEHVSACVDMIIETYPDVFRVSLDESKETIFNQTFAYFRAQQLFMGKYKQLDFLDMVLVKLGTQEYKDSLFHDFLKRNNFIKYKTNGNA